MDQLFGDRIGGQFKCIGATIGIKAGFEGRVFVRPRRVFPINPTLKMRNRVFADVGSNRGRVQSE